MGRAHQRVFHRYVLAFVVIACCAGCVSVGKEGSTMERIAGPAGTLVVDDGGRGGVPVVFVHSYAGSKAHWSAQLAHLTRSDTGRG